jgi:uncharacterized protein YjeT (DUF2065 family)
MAFIIKGLGIVFVFVGILHLLKPDIAKRIMGFFKKGKRVYFVGLIRFALAVVFLLGARECDIKWVIVLFGILFIISGLITFMLGPRRAGPILDWFQRQSNIVVRLIAVIILAVGVIIIYSA